MNDQVLETLIGVLIKIDTLVEGLCNLGLEPEAMQVLYSDISELIVDQHGIPKEGDNKSYPGDYGFCRDWIYEQLFQVVNGNMSIHEFKNKADSIISREEMH